MVTIKLSSKEDEWVRIGDLKIIGYVDEEFFELMEKGYAKIGSKKYRETRAEFDGGKIHKFKGIRTELIATLRRGNSVGKEICFPAKWKKKAVWLVVRY